MVSDGALIVPAAEGDRDGVVRRATQVAQRRATQAGGDPQLHVDLADLAERYFRFVSLDDLLEYHVDDLAGLLLSHRAAAATREQGTAVVRVFTPARAHDGWATGHTVVEIVDDDMPFLVDSVLGELARLGCGVHLLIHPRVAVRRALDGRLQQVLPGAPGVDVAADLPRAGAVESWIHLEIDRETNPERLQHVRARIQQVLDDVRVAVEDWPKMVRAAQDLVEELGQARKGIDPAEAGEAVELLSWLAEGHFTFVGYREYRLDGPAGEESLAGVTGTGLGVLRYDQRRSAAALSPQVRRAARDPHVLVLTKANSRSTVHRTGYLDYIGIKRFDDEGRVVGERRFIGLFSSSAYTESVRRVPVVRHKVAAVLARAGFPADSYSGKELLQVLETYPRDELFEISADDLYQIAVAVLQLQERRRTRLFLRTDTYGRFVSCLVYLSRDRFTTRVRLRIQAILSEAIGGTIHDYAVLISDSVLARLHFVVRMPPGEPVPEIDPAVLEGRVAAATRSWDEDFAEAALDILGEEQAAQLVRVWGPGFPEGYRADFTGWTAVGDVCRLQELAERVPADGERTIGVKLYEPISVDGATGGTGATAVSGAQSRLRDAGQQRLTLYRREPLSLTAVLPFLANLGLEVVDERPYRLEARDGTVAWLYDFGLRATAPGGRRSAATQVGEHARAMFVEAFTAAWFGEAESDGFDRLVLAAGLGWRQVAVLRAYARYLRQAGTAFGQDYLADCLVANAPITSLLQRLFETRFDPAAFSGDSEGREAACAGLVAKVEAELDGVASLDQDRILRAFLALILATTRTNRFVGRAAGPGAPTDPPRPCLAFKLDPAAVPDLPLPRPAHEIFVYSPAVEGVHLRFGAVARGGLRWSDRREDFRTEVLGLVKAQMTKNSVIVPTGAKGGFVCKRLPDPAASADPQEAREAWLAEGVACYRTFISGLLDLTDNLVSDPGTGAGTGARTGRVVVPAPGVVRYDGDDTYLVVAADKGTAAFSDIANEVAARYGFWLGDAFASGGSVGYDHKAMGITARGAWVSVQRHFRELGHDVATEPTTAVGVGDMSGDVFGNGMLLSEQLKLVAAFDHRHVFLDPSPDPATSFAERQRMFALPRSSWADYDTGLISPGGGVFPRSAKSVTVSPQVAEVLDVPAGARLTPAELIRAILRAPVDLLWNGGIGTYVKATEQAHAEVGDRANDAVRVNGADLRVRVIGEGGNLGLTQLGRVEAALAGVRVNTDAIDNSAGVDCSDHEVNIKILLAAADLAGDERTRLLHEMTGDVAALVLRDNYNQNVLLGNARRQAVNMLVVHRRFIDWLEQRGALDRSLEFLPDDEGLDERAAAGQGLTSPEFAVLVAYAKITLTADLEATSLPDEGWLQRLLAGYFPDLLVERFGDRLAGHPLRRQIVTTVLVNEMVNRGGITFAFRAQEETGASAEQVARAYVVCREIFDFRGFNRAVEELDGVLATGHQARLYLAFRRLLDRAVRWMLQSRTELIDVGAEIDRLGPVIAELSPQLPELVVGEERGVLLGEIDRLAELGVPTGLARRAAGLLTQFMLLDVAHISRATGVPAETVARIYMALVERLHTAALLRRITTLPRSDRWQMQARASLRYDVYAAMESITTDAIGAAGSDRPADDVVAGYADRNRVAFARAEGMIDEVLRMPSADIAALSVVLRALRAIARSDP